MNIKFIHISIFVSAFFLLASEAFFVVTNSNRGEFFAEGEPQNMSSGLYSAYIHEDNSDYNRIKAKGGLLIDFDLDGDLDLTYGYSSSYYFRNENGVFEDITQSYSIDDQGSRGMVSGDIDNNGYPDILKWRFQEYDPIDSLLYQGGNQDYRRMPHHLLLNFGAHEFSTIQYLSEETLPFLHSQGLVDIDLDGDLDIVAIEKAGDEQFYAFRNNGIDENGDILLEEIYSYFQVDGSSSRTLAIADFDNDGDQDVYIPRKYGINWLFENQTLTGSYDNVVYNPNPNPQFIEVAISNNVHDDSFEDLGSMGYGAAWGDYDNDNDFDLYLSNWGINRLFRNDGNGFTDVTNIYNVYSDSLSNGAAWGDFNNDGTLDLWAGNIRNRDDLFLNDGEVEWNEDYSPRFLTATQDIVAADYNNDGWLDAFTPGLQMASPAPNGAKFTSLLYKNVTPDSTLSVVDYNWVKINLEGANNNISNDGWSDKSNKSAIGARVIITIFEGSIQTREIISGKGHGSMDALELHYGVGYASQIQNIIVRWPSRDPNSNQQKVITYNGPFDVNSTYRIVEDLGFVGLKGDTNSDNNVDILDVMALIDIVLNDYQVSPEIYWAMDLNYSDDLNILDVTKLVYSILFR
ncbi:MAG: hypothetical protein CMG25_07000 [Candidatus Marinimicrobia bacterium]|nr:hypothetical protein [Candidatus Neomarinimicrobiota bacterium]|tara:strand:- start:858 stop:2747 length:1890 start_codon:yes stop_codon:yes gene_type:complete